MTIDNVMPTDEQELWQETMQRCGVNRHPRHLSKYDKRLQWFLLQAMTSDPYKLPDNETWAAWWEYHDKREAAKADGSAE